MFTRHLFTAIVSALIVFGFPVYSLAQVDHSGHGPVRTNSFQENRQADNLDRKTPVPGPPDSAGRLAPNDGGNLDHGQDHSGDGGHDSSSQAAGKTDHGGDNSASHSDSQPGRSGGHGSAGKAAEKPGHGGHESGGKSPGGTGHGDDSDSHGGSGASGLDPVRNTLLGGFILFNALVVAMAAILKKKALKGGAE